MSDKKKNCPYEEVTGKIDTIDKKLLETLIVSVGIPVIKSTTIKFPSLFVKYKLVLPIANPICFIFILEKICKILSHN